LTKAIPGQGLELLKKTRIIFLKDQRDLRKIRGFCKLKILEKIEKRSDYEEIVSIN
jgi:hypothetical protein